MSELNNSGKLPHRIESSSILSIRGKIYALAKNETATSCRNIVILALDGVPAKLARKCWQNAAIEILQSVFPATSSCAWLSSLTGATVGEHGIPGVVFQIDKSMPINIFQYNGHLGVPHTGNIFSDASLLGYCPFAITSDLEVFQCSLLCELTRYAHIMPGHRFYALDPWPSTSSIACEVWRSINETLAQPTNGISKLVWCFVEVDRRVHLHGYDDDVVEFLTGIDYLSQRLVERNCVVVAYSDHGLVLTHHDPSIAEALARIPAELNCAAGGAGRTRWFYASAAQEDRLVQRLQSTMPDSVHICSADEVFEPGSLARSRVGKVVLISRGTAFVTFDGYRFDHGSDTYNEVHVPLAQWG
jgi:hypothetical protein